MDGHQCWLKSGANKVVMGRKNLISAISTKSYNLNVREQVVYEAALKTVNTKEYDNELFWPKVDTITSIVASDEGSARQARCSSFPVKQ